MHTMGTSLTTLSSDMVHSKDIDESRLKLLVKCATLLCAFSIVTYYSTWGIPSKVWLSRYEVRLALEHQYVELLLAMVMMVIDVTRSLG